MSPQSARQVRNTDGHPPLDQPPRRSDARDRRERSSRRPGDPAGSRCRELGLLLPGIEEHRAIAVDAGMMLDLLAPSRREMGWRGRPRPRRKSSSAAARAAGPGRSDDSRAPGSPGSTRVCVGAVDAGSSAHHVGDGRFRHARPPCDVKDGRRLRRSGRSIDRSWHAIPVRRHHDLHCRVGLRQLHRFLRLLQRIRWLTMRSKGSRSRLAAISRIEGR